MMRLRYTLFGVLGLQLLIDVFFLVRENQQWLKYLKYRNLNNDSVVVTESETSASNDNGLGSSQNYQ